MGCGQSCVEPSALAATAPVFLTTSTATTAVGWDICAAAGRTSLETAGAFACSGVGVPSGVNLGGWLSLEDYFFAGETAKEVATSLVLSVYLLYCHNSSGIRKPICFTL